jgi:hypothetical protein
MDVQRMGALLTAFGSATTRRRIVRGLLAGAGGSALFRVSEGTGRRAQPVLSTGAEGGEGILPLDRRGLHARPQFLLH